jgi:hypothetical protein
LSSNCHNLSHYKNNPAYFDGIWWSSNDRVVRAVSGYEHIDPILTVPGLGQEFIELALVERGIDSASASAKE